MIKKLLSFLTLFTLLISPAFAEELEGFYYYYQLPEIYYETKSSKTTVDEAILQAIQKGEYHELETLLETSTSKVDPKTAERLVELVKNNRLKEAEELFETGSTSASEWVGETSTSWSGIRYDTGISNIASQSAENAKLLSTKEAEKFAISKGYVDAHELKKYAVIGQKDKVIAHYNMYYNSKTKELFLRHTSTGKFIKVD